MKKSLLLVALTLAIAPVTQLVVADATQLVVADAPEQADSREGDNTIYFTWDARRERIVEASSSRRLTAGQKIELLTRLSDRNQILLARGLLKNISEDQRYRVKGTLVQQIFHDGEAIRVKRLKVNRLFGPDQKIVAGSRYRLPSGKYSVRTDFVRK